MQASHEQQVNIFHQHSRLVVNFEFRSLGIILSAVSPPPAHVQYAEKSTERLISNVEVLNMS